VGRRPEASLDPRTPRHRRARAPRGPWPRSTRVHQARSLLRPPGRSSGPNRLDLRVGSTVRSKARLPRGEPCFWGSEKRAWQPSFPLYSAGRDAVWALWAQTLPLEPSSRRRRPRRRCGGGPSRPPFLKFLKLSGGIWRESLDPWATAQGSRGFDWFKISNDPILAPRELKLTCRDGVRQSAGLWTALRGPSVKEASWPPSYWDSIKEASGLRPTNNTLIQGGLWPPSYWESNTRRPLASVLLRTQYKEASGLRPTGNRIQGGLWPPSYWKEDTRRPLASVLRRCQSKEASGLRPTGINNKEASGLRPPEINYKEASGLRPTENEYKEASGLRPTENEKQGGLWPPSYWEEKQGGLWPPSYWKEKQGGLWPPSYWKDVETRRPLASVLL